MKYTYENSPPIVARAEVKETLAPQAGLLNSLPEIFWQTIKRLVDVVVSTVVGLVMLPSCLVIALLIRLASPGPVLVSQTRIGRNGKQFRSWKFRTAVAKAEDFLSYVWGNDSLSQLEWEPVIKTQKDPRVTKIGRFLRASSLDYLPQVWNVLWGDMSLVGPQPVVSGAPLTVSLFRRKDWRDSYQKVRPGLFSLSQSIAGATGEVGLHLFEMRYFWDLFYLRHRSIWLDFYVVSLAAAVFFRSERLRTQNDFSWKLADSLSDAEIADSFASEVAPSLTNLDRHQAAIDQERMKNQHLMLELESLRKQLAKYEIPAATDPSIEPTSIFPASRNVANPSPILTAEMPTATLGEQIDLLYDQINAIRVQLTQNPDREALRQELIDSISMLRLLQDQEAQEIYQRFEEGIKSPLGKGAKLIEQADELIQRYANPSV